jgi:hypothetical protein
MPIPLKIKPNKLNDYLEVMSKAVFQAGLSWASIEKRWPAFVDAFAEFDPKKIAKYSNEKIEDLLEDKALLLNEKKIKATISNAKTLLLLDKEHIGFKNYLHSFDSYDHCAIDLKKRFSYLGDLNVYYFLFRIGEPVPPFEKWITTIKGNHPRMKEMVEAVNKKSSSEFGDAINKRLS